MFKDKNNKTKFSKFSDSRGDLTSTGKPHGVRLSPEQKTHLIGKANQILNKGDIELAHTFFSKLKFYDGLMRVSKAYYKKGQCTQAYLAACQANAHKDVATLGKAIAGALRVWIGSETEQSATTSSTLVAKQRDIQPPNPQNIKKILELARANKNIQF